jgi:rhodanese-related sulfurtransferase
MNNHQSRSIRPAQLSLLLVAGGHAELLDVRTPPEFARGHVPGAKLIPLGDLNVQQYLKSHRSGAPVYVLCQAGMRAKKAIERFEAAGCFDGVLVEGGTQAWIDAGFAVERGETRVLPLMRQVQIVVGSLSAIGATLALFVNPWCAVVPLVTGCGLLVAGLTGTCGMALALAKMPWNRQKEDPTLCLTPENE